MAQIIDWIFLPGEYPRNCFEYLTKLRTDIPLSILQQIGGKRVGGHIIHRFSDVATKHHAMSNTRPTFYTHLTVSTDTMTPYAGSEDDYNIHFQGTMLWCIGIIS